MSARDDLYLFAMVGKAQSDGNRAMAVRKLDAFAAEVRAATLLEAATAVEQMWLPAATRLRRMAAAGQAPAPQPELIPLPGIPECAADCFCRTPAPQPEITPDAEYEYGCPSCGHPIMVGRRDEHRCADKSPITPNTAPGTPDLRQRIALAIATADTEHGAIGAPADRAHEYLPEADAVMGVVGGELARLREQVSMHRVAAAYWRGQAERAGQVGKDTGAATQADAGESTQPNGMTVAELAAATPGTYRCQCGHWDNVHGEFCFAAGCTCARFSYPKDTQPDAEQGGDR